MKSHLVFLLCAGASALAHYGLFRRPLSLAPPAERVAHTEALRIVLTADRPEPPPPEPAEVPGEPPPKQPEPPPVAPVVISAEEVAAAEESYWSTVRREVAEQLRYPMGARRDGCQSRIMVRLEIAADGRLANAEPIPPPGNAALTRATLAAVRRAAPFPPPPDILTPPVRAELPVRFEIGK